MYPTTSVVLCVVQASASDNNYLNEGLWEHLESDIWQEARECIGANIAVAVFLCHSHVICYLDKTFW